MSPEIPNPFAGPEFAFVWDGWQGRRTVSLTSGAVESYFVERRIGPLCARSALPFGIPVLADDRTPDRSRWLRDFFDLGRSVRSSATLLSSPQGRYPRVEWRHTQRSVVELDGRWPERVDAAVRRRARRAERLGWQTDELAPAKLSGMEPAIAANARRHGHPAQFDVAFFQRLRAAIPDERRLKFFAAVRDGEPGAVQVILSKDGYEVGWQLFATDAARQEGAVPFLMLQWLESSAARDGTHVDLGASPTESVEQFKVSLGAVPASTYTGIRRLHLWGT